VKAKEIPEDGRAAKLQRLGGQQKASRIERLRTRPAARALQARMRRCLKLRQGAKPPETPSPLSLCRNRKGRRTRRQGIVNRTLVGSALDTWLSFPERFHDQGKGAPAQAASACLPLVGPEEWLNTRETKSVLDKDRPSHRSAGRIAGAASTSACATSSTRVSGGFFKGVRATSGSRVSGHGVIFFCFGRYPNQIK